MTEAELGQKLFQAVTTLTAIQLIQVAASVAIPLMLVSVILNIFYIVTKNIALYVLLSFNRVYKKIKPKFGRARFDLKGDGITLKDCEVLEWGAFGIEILCNDTGKITPMSNTGFYDKEIAVGTYQQEEKNKLDSIKHLVAVLTILDPFPLVPSLLSDTGTVSSVWVTFEAV